MEPLHANSAARMRILPSNTRPEEQGKKKKKEPSFDAHSGDERGELHLQSSVFNRRGYERACLQPEKIVPRWVWVCFCLNVGTVCFYVHPLRLNKSLATHKAAPPSREWHQTGRMEARLARSL